MSKKTINKKASSKRPCVVCLEDTIEVRYLKNYHSELIQINLCDKCESVIDIFSQIIEERDLINEILTVRDY